MFKSLFLASAILCITHIPALVLGVVPNGTYVIRNKAYLDRVLDEKREAGIAIGWSSNGGKNQMWKVTPTNPSQSALFVSIQNAETGNYINRTGGMQLKPYEWMLSTEDNGDTLIQKILDFTYALNLTGPGFGAEVNPVPRNSNEASQLWWFVAI